jgi:hypothetical protein
VLSTDASHTTAFVKAVKNGCKTNIAELQDKSGNLLPASAFKGDLVAMSEGWEWIVISRDVESAFPELVELFQRGLNLKHAAVTRAHEIEVARSLVELSKHMTLNDAQEELRLNQPVCVDYISKVSQYVELYSGEGELVAYLDEFSKAIGQASAQLGQEFMTALVDLKTKSASTTLPFVRMGLWMAQVSSPKIVDGITKHISVSMLSKFKKDDELVTVEALELLLKQGWELGPAASKDSTTGNFTGPARLAYGKFAVRCILHFLSAQKDSREPKGFKDLATINSLYHKDLEGKATSLSMPRGGAAESQARTLSTLAATTNAKDIFLAKNKFLTQFTHFTCKEYGSKIFTLQEVKMDTIIFEHKPLFGDEEQLEVSHSSVVKLWRGVQHASSPQACDEALWTLLLPENQANTHILQCQATLAMHAGYLANSATTGFGFGMSPTCVFIKDSEEQLTFKKNEFKIVCYGALKAPTNADKGDESKLMMVHNKSLDAQFIVTAFTKKLPKTSTDKFIVSPFFMVGSTAEPGEANMKLAHVSQDGWSIPMFVNTRQVKSKDVLLVLQPQDEAKGSASSKKRKTA